ncbi:Ig-like domain-containing protein [Conexibacter sp. JD483]|uniref:Ig-like domain-containing protein n=1 Tax=unclassified Conexibacter TaxID=2627773 RepID=UPI0027181DBF|nr:MULTISPECIES: Ig-like domain-containing protein [unclassified Conexibacter]MDO8185662.1 Ig-like domain-containing protein [Conexibacter sp. CPCC 205706]MDO8198835.1 Ig-like domain-containing protein [Conexibacter sp. CPCC 205762]MDR9367815.1 Ig-like domain-containing protein [Conexibacter sp. JD483]
MTNAAAAPSRSANTTDYTTARFLQSTLGLSTSDSDPAIEPVTYDHFQWLLQQEGKFAVLIGDPALDASFAARAQDVEAAADAAGVERVFWFDPNLSGSVRVGNVNEPNLDIRNPAGITSLPTASRTIYGNAWLNLVGQYLGNGVSLAFSGGAVGSESTVIRGTTRASVVNDAGGSGTSTKVGDTAGGALYDYTATDLDPDASDSYFFIYDKDNTAGGQPQRIVSWTNLTEQADSASARRDAGTAIATAGGASRLSEIDQFHWWKEESNERQVEQAGSVSAGGTVPVITDADDADEWRIEQITYPELVHLLKSDARRDAVILFGGTWCPNTRPVLPAINRYAQENDVHVFNFDTVLDGGTVGGATTSAVNPLQTRNLAASGATTNANASFLYGDLVDQHLTNIRTQYDPSRSASQSVTYYSGGDSGSSLKTTRKLQVPFLLGYRGSTSSDPNAGVTRQWIIDKGDGTYTEYMSSWAYVNPQPNQLNLSTLPLDAPIWTTLNAQLAAFSWQTDPATLYQNTAIDSDAAQFLTDADTATVTYTAPSTVAVARGGANPRAVSPAALSAALTTLGGSAPASYNDAKAAYVAAQPSPSEALTTVVAAWGLAQNRKNSINRVWGNATTPSSIAGGAAAKRAAEVFFGGLPGGVVSTQTVTADPFKAGTNGSISIAIANEYGRVPAGDVSLVVKQGGATVVTGSATVVGNAASFALPPLAAGSYDYTLAYAGDDQIAPFSKSGSLTVTPADAVIPPPPVDRTPVTPPGGTGNPPETRSPAPAPAVKKVKAKSVKAAVTKLPTSKAGGSLKLTVAAPKGTAAATGKVTITLKKGKTTKKVTGTLKKGVVTVKLPKLPKGTWKATIAWAGDARYLAVKTTATVKVKK